MASNEKCIDKQQKKSVGTFLPQALLPILLLVIIIVVLILNSALITRQAVRNAQEILEDSATEQTATLNATLSGQYETLETFASSIAMQESVDTNNAVLRMSAITEASPFLHLFYIMPDGTSYADNDMVFNVSEREYFLQAKGGVRSIQLGFSKMNMS